jgi:hypothetical protein
MLRGVDWQIVTDIVVKRPAPILTAQQSNNSR